MDEEDTYENEGITLLIHFGVKDGGGRGEGGRTEQMLG